MAEDATICKVNEFRTRLSSSFWKDDRDELRTICDQLNPYLLNIKDRVGWTLFMFLCADEHGTQLIQYLFNRSDFHQSLINPNIQDKEGNTALHHVCNFNRIDTVNIIMELPSINANIRNGFGTTPLHWAINKGHGGVVTRLLEYMICDEIEMKNEQGYDAVELAFKNGNEGLAYHIKNVLRRKLSTPGQWAAKCLFLLDIFVC